MMNAAERVRLEQWLHARGFRHADLRPLRQPRSVPRATPAAEPTMLRRVCGEILAIR